MTYRMVREDLNEVTFELGARERDLDIWEKSVLVEGNSCGPAAECA